MLHYGLFEVQLVQSGVPGFVRRPVDGGSVLPDPQLGHVHEVRGGSDPDHLGTAEPVYRHVGDFGHHLCGCAHGKGPAHLEPQLGNGPCRVLSLHLGDRDARGAGFAVLIDVRCRPVGSGIGPRVLVDLRQGPHFVPGNLPFPPGQPFGFGRFLLARGPGDHPPGMSLAAPGVLRRLLPEQPYRPL